MKLHLFSLMMLCLMAFTQVQAQTVLYDFESPETTTAFTYFGSSLDGQAAAVIANPNPTGLNTSANVAEYIKAGDAQTWAGSYANPNPAAPIDATSGGQICVDVHFDHIGNLAVKLEQSSTGGEDWLTIQENTTTGEWETLCFDLSAPSVEGGMAPATGHIYGQIVLFFDFNQAGTGSDVITYFDNVVQQPAQSCTTMYDFEAPETTTAFTYFGSSLDGQAAAVIANPNPTGVNMSANVAEYIKAGDAQTWAGSYANPNPASPIDATSGGQICVDVHFDHIGNVAVKLEQSSTGGEDWLTIQENTTTGEWETLCFDLSDPSVEGGMAPATGHIYGQIVLFFDFNQAGTGSDVITYFDNIEFCGAAGPTFRDVEFAVDMNNYTGNFDNVAVAGDFNGWNGTSNIMEDLDGDGVYTTVITLATGTYEYKFVLDDWTVQEEFNGSENCTKMTIVDPQTVFVNRLAGITPDTESLGTVCFNSCYACGAAVQIRIDLGFDGVTPDSSGVYLAGGLEFGAPSPRFQLKDSDEDGIYSITIERQIGFGGFFTFTNGFCPDYSCKEDISNQLCAQPDNFNDRLLLPVLQDTVIATCFAVCSDNTDCIILSLHEELAETPGFELFPNPAQQQVTLQFNRNLQEEKEITVFNLTGAVVQTAIAGRHTEQHDLDLSKMPEGIYLIQVKAANEITAKRLFKRN